MQLRLCVLPTAGSQTDDGTRIESEPRWKCISVGGRAVPDRPSREVHQRETPVLNLDPFPIRVLAVVPRCIEARRRDDEVGSLDTLSPDTDPSLACPPLRIGKPAVVLRVRRIGHRQSEALFNEHLADELAIHPYMAQQATEPVGIRSVNRECDIAREQLLQSGSGSLGQALPVLGCVDTDQPDTSHLSIDRCLESVAVEHLHSRNGSVRRHLHRTTCGGDNHNDKPPEQPDGTDPRSGLGWSDQPDTVPGAMPNDSFRRLAAITSITTYLLIVLGAVVRATGSGLGCPDWPTCYGSFIPPLRADAIIEWSHRSLAAVVGIMVLVLFWRALRSRSEHPVRFKTTAVVVLLLILQAWLGQVVVETELSPALVSFHLATAMLMLGILVGLAVGKLSPPRTPEHRGLWYLAVGVFVAIVLGALVRGAGAGLAFLDWPLMDGSILPAGLGEEQRALHFLHRIFVAVLALYVVVAWWRSAGDHRRAIAWTGLLFALQVLTGAALVWSLLSTFFVVAHVALAAATWVAALWAAIHFGAVAD